MLHGYQLTAETLLLGTFVALLAAAAHISLFNGTRKRINGTLSFFAALKQGKKSD